MLFKSFTVMQMVDEATRKALTSITLEDLVVNKPAGDPTAGRWCVVGFSKPEHFGETIVYDCSDGTRVLNVEFRERLLPWSVIKTKTRERVDEMVKRAGRKLNRKEIAQLKDDVVNELLPNAFIKSSNVTVMIVGNYLIVGSTSVQVVDDVLYLLRATIQNVAIGFHRLKRDPVQWMTSQLLDPSDDNFDIGKSAVLKNGGSVVRVKDVSLQANQIEEYLTEGFRVNELAVTWDDRKVEFTLNDKLAIRKLKMSNLIEVQVDEEDRVSVFDADVALMGGTLKRLLADLLSTLPSTES